MHEAQPINGVATSSSRVLLRRLTQHHHHQGSFQMQPPQQQQGASLKCPRCDSLNTKFCYYNNYNLSQPRHFCKNCRRYWTKGGVLRNVPVGGGCRKSKRSSSSSSKNSKSSSTSSTTPTHVTVNKDNNNNGQNSHSSSDSSSATATTVGVGSLFQIPEVENFGISSNDLLFSEGFMGLINDQNKNNLSNNNDINNVALHEGNNNNNNNGNVTATASFSEFLQSQGVDHQEWDMGKICGGVHQREEKIAGDFVNQTDRIEDLLLNKGSNVGLTTLDWHLITTGNQNRSTSNNNQENLFVVPDNSFTVDHHHQGFWDQSTVDQHLNSQWSDSTTSHLPLFLP